MALPDMHTQKALVEAALLLIAVEGECATHGCQF
jgi:hypothetical protein